MNEYKKEAPCPPLETNGESVELYLMLAIAMAKIQDNKEGRMIIDYIRKAWDLWKE